jgi:hypothetical protein
MLGRLRPPAWPGPRGRWWLVSVFVSTVAVAGVATSVASSGSGGADVLPRSEQGAKMDNNDHDPVLSVLAQPRSSTEGLSNGGERILESGIGKFFADPSDVRLAFASEDSALRAYVGVGIQPGTICLAVVDGLHTRLVCGEVNQLKLPGQFGTIAMSMSTAKSDTYSVVGVISDDVTSVRLGSQDATIGQNVFMAETSAPVVEVGLHTATGTHVVTLPVSQLPTSPDDQRGDAEGQPELRSSSEEGPEA